MAKPTPHIDFRATRKLLPDEAFALLDGPRPGPSDLVGKDVWKGIMHLPDDVAITTSNHHGSQLAQLYALWGGWLEAIGDKHDQLFLGMLDATDCLQTSTFDSLHGYYRSALSNLRSAIELVTIGSLGNLSPTDVDYVRWSKQNIGSLPFSSCLKKLRNVAKGTVAAAIFQPDGWLDALYEELCAYTHSRPDASDGEMWQSNGPIYATEAFDKVFTLQVTAYAACFILAKVGRPKLNVPRSARFLFTTSDLLWRSEIAVSYQSLRAMRKQ